jgi:hypothetical protein
MAPVPPLDAPPEELETLLPFDPAAAAAVGPEALRAIDAPRTELDVAGLDRGEPGDLLEDDGFHAAASLAEDQAAEWQPEPGALDHGFQLESGGSFDASADAAAPEWATGGSDPMPWESTPAEAGGVAPTDLAAPAFALDFSGQELTPTEPEQAGALELLPVPAGPPMELEQESAFEEIPTLDVEEVMEEVPAEALEAVDAQPIGEPAPAVAAPGPGPAPMAAPPAADAEADPLDVIDTAEADVVEPLADDHRIQGVHRVVVHSLEGQVKRGLIQDVDLAAPELPLASTPGGPTEPIPTDHIKAVFFMLAPGEQPSPPEGSRVRVTFRDGRQVAGFSPDYREETFGFFMIPADARTSTARIWVYRSAVRQVSVS